jgi:NAD(P)-dependent dehydrogenase (short-subunit alcohol dehydrogenase family)
MTRLDRLTQAAEELGKATGQTCIPAQADVRDPTSLREAVSQTIEKFGKIDYVICGKRHVFVSERLPSETDIFLLRRSRQFLGAYFRNVRERVQDRDGDRHCKWSLGAFSFVPHVLEHRNM